jgi:hypothetical protein
VQALDAALAARDTGAVAKALPPAYDSMLAAGLGRRWPIWSGPSWAPWGWTGRPGQIALWLALQAAQPQVVADPPPTPTPVRSMAAELCLGRAGIGPAPRQGRSSAPRLLFPGLSGPLGTGMSRQAAAALILANKRGEAMLARHRRYRCRP